VGAASNPHRAFVYDFSLGCDASPADNSFVHIVQRCTTAGTGSALTPNALDPGDSQAATMVVKDTVTADPTLTAAAFLFGVALNARATYRWVAAPGGELVTPATASNGIIIGLKSATTTSFQYTAHFDEH